MSGDGVGSTSGRRAALYVLSDKGGLGSTSAGVEPVPVEYPDARATKHAFKKLLRATAPSAPQTPDEPGFLKLVFLFSLFLFLNGGRGERVIVNTRGYRKTRKN